jgi:hypothetical protein
MSPLMNVREILQLQLSDFLNLGRSSLDPNYAKHEPNVDAIERTFFIYTLGIAGLCYGGLHLSGWNASFPSNTQALLWKISATNIAASGFWVLIVWLLEKAEVFLQKSAFRSRRTPIPWRWLLSYPFATAGAAFYVLSRVYPVVECFITLTHLPDGVYKVPVWS